MRSILLLILLLSSSSLAEGPQGPNLKDLYDGHHWFELRRALSTQSGPALYQGAVASAFDEKQEAERLLHSVIGAEPHSDVAYQAHEWLSYLYMREGQYQEFIAETKTKRAARPDRATSENELAIMDAFSSFPNQTTVKFQPSRIHYAMEHNDMVVPLLINGHRVHFIVDTDANISAISPAQARLLGITITSSSAKGLGATGAGAAFSVAVASHLQIGNIRLRDVAFMVYPDESALFKHLPFDRRGLIGLPVLRALRQLQWTTKAKQKGSLNIGYSSTSIPEKPNICFDGSDPVTEIKYEGKVLDVLLDTGSEATDLWPPFARSFPSILHLGNKTSQPVTGFGESASVESVSLPQLAFSLGGFDVLLRPAHVLLKSTTPNSDWYYGRLGIDMLNKAKQVTLNFRDMTLKLE